MELRAAYRRLVRRYHPDMGEGHPIEEFHAIQEAWEVLRDPELRVRHRAELQRRAGRWAPPPGFGRRPDPSPPPPRGGAARETGRSRGGEMELEIELPAAMAARGGHFTTRIPVDVPCPACHGHSMERLLCDLCHQAGILKMKVRGTLRIPPFVRHGQRLRLHCYLELFGARTVYGRIFLT